MHSTRNKIFKTLIIFVVFLLIITQFKNCSTSLRIKSVDSGATVLGTFNRIISAAKRIIPFASLREDNRLLKDKVNLLTREMEEMKAVSEENQRLRALLDFIEIISYRTIPAQVIGRDPTNWANTLIIDKGLNNGVKYNKAVLSTKGLVGRVVEVGRRSSKILLITDTSSKVGVVIGRNRQGGILTGGTGDRCKMLYISLDSDVYTGDKVLTAGFGSVFPKGILVGEIAAVGKEPGRLYKYAIVKPAQDLSKLEEVLCIK